MFQLCIFYDKHNEEENVVEAIYIKCINCNKDTGIHLKIKIEKRITTFVLNIILYRVGMLWTICYSI